MSTAQALKRFGFAALHTPKSASQWILGATFCYLALGLGALLTWRLTGNLAWVEKFFQIPGALLLVSLALAGAALSVRAVQEFSPYTEVKDPNPEARESMRVLIGRARENKQFLFLFVNNRLEGNAPSTILSLVE